jgi:hypothetical protein
VNNIPRLHRFCGDVRKLIVKESIAAQYKMKPMCSLTEPMIGDEARIQEAHPHMNFNLPELFDEQSTCSQFLLIRFH